MRSQDQKKSIKYHRKIQRLMQLFNNKKAELAATYEGYHELLGFVDQCQRWGISDRGQENTLDDWIDLLERWPFVGGAPTGTLSRTQRQRIMARDRFTCSVCGRPADEVHHNISRSKGGRNVPDNLTALCEKCHEDMHRKKS